MRARAGARSSARRRLRAQRSGGTRRSLAAVGGSRWCGRGARTWITSTTNRTIEMYLFHGDRIMKNTTKRNEPIDQEGGGGVVTTAAVVDHNDRDGVRRGAECAERPKVVLQCHVTDEQRHAPPEASGEPAGVARVRDQLHTCVSTCPRFHFNLSTLRSQLVKRLLRPPKGGTHLISPRCGRARRQHGLRQGGQQGAEPGQTRAPTRCVRLVRGEGRGVSD